MKKVTLISIFIITILGGCSSVEMPENDATGADEMRLSPCVCSDLDYQFKNYQTL